MPVYLFIASIASLYIASLFSADSYALVFAWSNLFSSLIFSNSSVFFSFSAANLRKYVITCEDAVPSDSCLSAFAIANDIRWSCCSSGVLGGLAFGFFLSWVLIQSSPF